jgi:hypothetical protein
MIKKVLLTGAALLTAVTFARADLGWTYAQCKRQYGRPRHTEQKYGLTVVDWYSKRIHISVAFDGDTAVSISYIGRPSVLTPKLAAALMRKNGPGLEWDNKGENSDGSFQYVGYSGGQLAVYTLLSSPKRKIVKLRITKASYNGRFDGSAQR